MKNTIKSALVLLSLLVAGAACEKSTTTGPGGQKLSVSKPSDQTMKRGTTTKVAIAIDRHGFSGPVKVKFTGLPQGVTVVDSMDLPSNESRADYTLAAAPEAGLVENAMATVTVEKAGEMGISETFKITVKDR